MYFEYMCYVACELYPNKAFVVTIVVKTVCHLRQVTEQEYLAGRLKHKPLLWAA